MKWIPLKTQQPPMDTEVLVSDGKYVHEAEKCSYGWNCPETVWGYEAEFNLPADPLYWSHKPKSPKVRSEDIPDPVVPKKRKYVRPPKKGTIDRMLWDNAKTISKQQAAKLTSESPWVRLLDSGQWPESPGSIIEGALIRSGAITLRDAK